MTNNDIVWFVIMYSTLVQLSIVLAAKSDIDVFFLLHYPQDRVNTQVIYRFALAQMECTS